MVLWSQFDSEITQFDRLVSKCCLRVLFSHGLKFLFKSVTRFLGSVEYPLSLCILALSLMTFHSKFSFFHVKLLPGLGKFSFLMDFYLLITGILSIVEKS